MSSILLGILTGTAFGAVLVLSGLSNPRLIIDMLRLKDLHLLKVLITALVSGIVGIAVLDAFGLAHTSVKPLHTLAVAIGGAIFGIGFALSGYCPGTSLAAAAEGRGDALFSVLGGLAGTAAFTFLYDFLSPMLVEPLSFGSPTLYSWLGVPALALAAPIGLAGAGMITLWLRSERPKGSAPRSSAGEAAQKARSGKL